MRSLTFSPETRRAIAFLCIAAVVCVAVLPAFATDVGTAFLIPLWLVVPSIIVVVVRRSVLRFADQPVSLLSLVLFRAPPVTLPLL